MLRAGASRLAFEMSGPTKLLQQEEVVLLSCQTNEQAAKAVSEEIAGLVWFGFFSMCS